jgi:hypothetical protein
MALFWSAIAYRIDVNCFAYKLERLGNLLVLLEFPSLITTVGGVLLQVVAALLGTLLLVGKKWELLRYCRLGVQAMQSIPIVIGGSVLLGTILGAVWLNEILTVKS